MDKLAPCPFCGNKTRVVVSPISGKFCISCTRELCFDGPYRDTEQEAAEEWNNVFGGLNYMTQEAQKEWFAGVKPIPIDE